MRKIDYHPNNFCKTSLSLIFIQDLGKDWAEVIGSELLLCATNRQETGSCSDTGNDEGKKILAKA
jgi:hypothetical protein